MTTGPAGALAPMRSRLTELTGYASSLASCSGLSSVSTIRS